MSDLSIHSMERYETLCKWIAKISPHNLSTSSDDLGNGLLLNLIVAQIDEEHFQTSKQFVLEVTDDSTKEMHREHNLNLLLQNLTSFYQEKLSCIILLELPIIMSICRDSKSPEGIVSLERFLLLILGAAVQCENRVKYVDSIQSMVAHDQVVMMQAIQDVLEQIHKAMWDKLNDLPQDALVDNCEKAYASLNQAVALRDRYAQEASELRFQLSSVDSSPTELEDDTDGRNRGAVHRLRGNIIELQDELDSKNDLVQELLELYEQSKSTKLRLETKYRDLEIKLEDNTALRDEIDVWKTKLELATKTAVSSEAYEERSKENANLKSINEDLRAQVDMLEDRNISLREQIKAKISLEARVEVMTSESRTLRSELNSITTAYTRSVTKVKELNTAAIQATREKEHAIAEASLKQLQRDPLVSVQTETHPNSLNTSTTTTNSTASNQSIAVFEEKLRQFDVREASSFNKIKTLHQTVEDLELELEKQTTLRTSLQTTHDSNLDELQILRSTVRNLQEEKATLQTETEIKLVKANQKLEKTVSSLSEASDKCESLGKTNKSDRETTTKLESCLDKAQERCATLQKELADREHKVRELTEARAADIATSEDMREHARQLQGKLSSLMSQNQLLLRRNDPSSPVVVHTKGRRSMGSRLNGLIRRIKAPSFSEQGSLPSMSPEKLSQFETDLSAINELPATPNRDSPQFKQTITLASPSTPSQSPGDNLIGIKRMMLENRIGSPLNNLIKACDSTMLETPKQVRNEKTNAALEFLLQSPKHEQKRGPSAMVGSPLSRKPHDVSIKKGSKLAQGSRRPLGNNNTSTGNRSFTVKRRDLNTSITTTSDMSQMLKLIGTPEYNQENETERWSEMTHMIDMALAKTNAITNRLPSKSGLNGSRLPSHQATKKNSTSRYDSGVRKHTKNTSLAEKDSTNEFVSV
eukprot:m.172069 g.172069  ORF g.172069 m.172069 type:complete len:932 (+) comp31667_c0_seq1:262-3057(+)